MVNAVLVYLDLACASGVDVAVLVVCAFVVIGTLLGYLNGVDSVRLLRPVRAFFCAWRLYECSWQSHKHSSHKAPPLHPLFVAIAQPVCPVTQLQQKHNQNIPKKCINGGGGGFLGSDLKYFT